MAISTKTMSDSALSNRAKQPANSAEKALKVNEGKLPPTPIAKKESTTPKAAPPPKPVAVKPKKAVTTVAKAATNPSNVPKSPTAAKSSAVVAQKEHTIQSDRKRALLAKAAEKIANIQPLSSTINAASSNRAMPRSNVDPNSSVGLKGEALYREELACFLEAALQLPEYGEVEILLTLERTGKVAKVAIARSSSDRNSRYVVDALAENCFEPFGSAFGSEGQHTFVIVLK